MRRLLVTALVAVPVFLLLSWWNAVVGVLFGIGALAWVLGPVYFGWYSGQGGDWSDDGESRRDARHRKFFE